MTKNFFYMIDILYQIDILLLDMSNFQVSLGFYNELSSNFFFQNFSNSGLFSINNQIPGFFKF